jgi:hypothetical protein
MNDISEFQMSIAFEKLIKSNFNLKGLPKFDLMYKEIVCQQGIADFIGVDSKNNINSLSAFDDILSLESGTLVFSLLKIKASRTKQFLQEKTGLSNRTLNRVLKELLFNDFIRKSGEDAYVVSPDIMIPKINIWAFELKLSNWKRALFQSLQYKAFANYSIGVFPIEKEKVLRKQVALFTELNVGILLFDIKENTLEFLFRPKKEKPSSKWHTLFAMGKLANQYNSDNIDIGSALLRK